MTGRVILVAHGATEATRRARFPLDETLEPEARVAAGAAGPGLATRLHRDTVALTGPSRRCRETAEALGLTALGPAEQAGLDDWGLGTWAGRSLDQVPLEELQAWRTDPAAAPHGGESLDDLLHRVGGWLDDPGAATRRVAVTHPAVVRAATGLVLAAPAASFWRIDAGPLAVVELRGGPGRWALRL